MVGIKSTIQIYNWCGQETYVTLLADGPYGRKHRINQIIIFIQQCCKETLAALYFIFILNAPDIKPGELLKARQAMAHMACSLAVNSVQSATQNRCKKKGRHLNKINVSPRDKMGRLLYITDIQFSSRGQRIVESYKAIKSIG